MSRKYRRLYMGMKYLKLYESFNEEDIYTICREYNINNYTINNGVVDVDGSVILSNVLLKELPLKFGVVTGDFRCNNNRLKSLKGCPTYIGGGFFCYNNYLTSLIGCPDHVGGGFHCDNNILANLEGCPKYVGGNFNCDVNNLTSLEGCPTYVGDSFSCYCNQLVSLEGLPKIKSSFYCDSNPVYEIYSLFPNNQSFFDSLDYNYFREGTKINKIRLTQALEEIGLECPEEIKGYVWE